MRCSYSSRLPHITTIRLAYCRPTGNQNPIPEFSSASSESGPRMILGRRLPLLLLFYNVVMTTGQSCIRKSVNGGWESYGNCPIELAAITAQLSNLQKNVTGLSQKIEEIECNVSGVLYKGTCYTVPHLPSTRNFDRAKATEVCREANSNLAEIHDKDHLQRLANLVASKMPSTDSEIHLMIGMTYDKVKKTLRYRSGEEVPRTHLNWWGGYPNDQLAGNMFL